MRPNYNYYFHSFAAPGKHDDVYASSGVYVRALDCDNRACCCDEGEVCGVYAQVYLSGDRAPWHVYSCGEACDCPPCAHPGVHGDESTQVCDDAGRICP